VYLKYEHIIIITINNNNNNNITTTIKLCLMEAQTCALPLFCDRYLEINPP